MDTPTVVRFTNPAPASLPRDGGGARAARSDPASASGSTCASMERELARLRARVRELSAELVQAQEAACRHVARELHDGVGAELTATRFALASVETWLPADAPAQCSNALAVANRSLDAVCAATRQAVAELHAPALEAGIVGALAQWTGEFAARTQLRTSFVCSADVRLTRLPADAALAVFRVAQEALNNIAKHARAASADVRIETSRRHLTLIVSDDGVGVARHAQRRSGHFGLSGMKARCAAFDGTLRVSARRAEPQGPGQARRGAGDGARGTLVRARFAWDAMLADALPAGLRAAQS
ncbi:histidine kinase [bacterium M00.F.Ca.ET.228.01.1.1]|uniref:sensor histidine kinase n=1 Tax=Paraburkholderia phenoliruptrix TaxID=252970 RepID=UPI0010927E53|nr:ATP-binding protein [Paraburkholderia phenoliruptrix]TGP44807.1 histidine kinase [bacterium M00.F.Ca.ET.228.01.1.1]TGS02690.1 histidine kinase [bacterium M00.F.Ca.ET.191.01.1.1]TGU06072.1 histidine kinase [bacterium M00.F.Ca.ET.155.01.1.1]MBW0450678.1 histidine kinase [Paraburkholderia phenoliruptrix]MBW9098110.1 histidine kinase [Paraburkholderia phenoliruptrix]